MINITTKNTKNTELKTTIAVFYDQYFVIFVFFVVNFFFSTK